MSGASQEGLRRQRRKIIIIMQLKRQLTRVRWS